MSAPGASRSAAAILLAAAALVASPFGHACSPPPILEESGFLRSHVKRLPQNAKGVMFLPAPGMLRAADFRAESTDDGRLLKLRVRQIKNNAWVRIEPVEGFRPGVRYLFRYLPAHRPWRHADSHAVTIDDATANTAGRYAIEPAPAAVNRVVMVTTWSGSCSKPAPVVLHAFSHAVPAGVMPYRDILHYEVHAPVAAAPRLTRADPLADEWGPDAEPALHGSMGPLGRSEIHPRGPRDAVIAPCGNRWSRVRMRSTVAFPEVDDRRHLTREVTLDLSQGAGGGCGEVEALLQTMRAGPPEAVLREVCRHSLGMEFAMGQVRLAATPVEDWERALEYPVGEMSSTCNLVALAHLWRNAAQPPAPALVDRIAAALHRGYRIPDAAARDKIAHALDYLVADLPARYRPQVAPRLLKPLLPMLVDELASPDPRRPDELARLIAAAGNLPPAVRARLLSIAAGKTRAAQAAKAVLADQRR